LKKRTGTDRNEKKWANASMSSEALRGTNYPGDGSKNDSRSIVQEESWEERMIIKIVN